MDFAGIQKLTLLDFPGRTACTLFTQGCPFRCPFCQNASLLPFGTPETPLPGEDVFAFLQKRRGVLDGVCVTGGEPLMHRELPDFLKRVKEMGFAVKLDTNGFYPGRLRSLIADGLIDRVAMDIKNSPARYAETIGLSGADVSAVMESAALLMAGKTPFEFRTTVVRELHAEKDFLEIGLWLRGNEDYFLQGFMDGGGVLREGLHPVEKQQMERFRLSLLPYIPHTVLRGV